MLNPALVAAVLVAAASEYRRVGRGAMPWELAFIIVPLCLHRQSRDELPGRTNAHLPHWVAEHPLLQAGLARRAVDLRWFVLEGLRFAIAHGYLELEDGLLVGNWTAKVAPADVGDIRSIVKSAAFVGRWLTKTDKTSTVFALFGLAP
jgi:hypothetical protein